jgi:hypothetical protein
MRDVTQAEQLPSRVLIRAVWNLRPLRVHNSRRALACDLYNCGGREDRASGIFLGSDRIRTTAELAAVWWVDWQPMLPPLPTAI